MASRNTIIYCLEKIRELLFVTRAQSQTDDKRSSNQRATTLGYLGVRTKENLYVVTAYWGAGMFHNIPKHPRVTPKFSASLFPD